jgi:hypothetical protein
MAKVKTETIHGVEVEFEVDSKGRFTADVGDHGEFSGATLQEAEDQVTKVLKRAKATQAIDVTFVNITSRKRHSYGAVEFQSGEDALDVTLRGYAARTRDWLITVDGKKEKISKGYSDSGPVVCRRLTPAEHATWKQLQEARRVAATAIEDFIGARKLDTKKLTEGD